ncbi:hypothetical protein niasHT_025896 [Heterodera trifolii]|uniref:Uncharacterized protein n=1 Tax=Heterodera trifolii TaxID=157864 RepID=A0ABD2JV91_9BILA
MALNIDDKRSLFNAMIPAVNFTLSSNGITVASERLSTPRVIPFDIPSKCRHCKSTEAEMDYMVTKDGVTVWCTRINGTAFVPFDCVYDLPGYTFFKIKNKGRVFNVEHGQQQPISTATPYIEKQNTAKVQRSHTAAVSVSQVSSAVDSTASKNVSSNINSAKPKKQQQHNDYQELIDSLTVASTLLPSQLEQHPPIIAQATDTQPMDFVDTMSAMTTFLPSQSTTNSTPVPKSQQSETLVDVLSAAVSFLPSEGEKTKEQQHQTDDDVSTVKANLDVKEEDDAIKSIMKH